MEGEWFSWRFLRHNGISGNIAVQGFGDNTWEPKICVLWRENVARGPPAAKHARGHIPSVTLPIPPTPTQTEADLGKCLEFFPPKKRRSKKKRRIFSQKKNRPNIRSCFFFGRGKWEPFWGWQSFCLRRKMYGTTLRKRTVFFPRKMVVWSLEHEFSEGFSQTVRGLGWQ